MCCHELIFLEIPSLLQRLSHLIIIDCRNLELIESKAPNLCSFRYMGDLVRLSLGDSLRDFEIVASSWDFVRYACQNLPNMLPNLEALDIDASLVYIYILLNFRLTKLCSKQCYLAFSLNN
jgi:hypothetical protein